MGCMDVCVGKSGLGRCSHTLSIACTTDEGGGLLRARVYAPRTRRTRCDSEDEK